MIHYTMRRRLREYIHKIRRRNVVFLLIILLSMHMYMSYFCFNIQRNRMIVSSHFKEQNFPGIFFVADEKTPNEWKECDYKQDTASNEKNYTCTKGRKVVAYEQRLHTLKKACRQLGYVEDTDTTNIRAHISPDHKLLYCRVNKCASTMTLELLKRLFACDTECLIKVAEHVRLNENAREIMNDAFSFMVVREPYGRLFSTYCNIFYFPKEDWVYRGSKIIKLTRLNISYDSMTYGHDLTFAELVKYTVDAYETGGHLDEHVRPMHHKSCNPCVFNFDFIAHLETLQTDFDFIFDQLNNKIVLGMYPRETIVSLKTWTLFGPINHLFRTIPLLKGSNIPIYNVYLRAWCYYQITGHILNTIDFPYNMTTVLDITKKDFLQKIKMAMDVSAIKKSELKLQKTEAIMQAYSTISVEYMERLSKVVQGDCLLFGYDEKPSNIFGKNKCFDKCSNFNYFKGV